MMKTYKILLSFFLILISGMGFSQSVPSYVPTNGLVGWWGFNGNAQDGSGNGNHGTVNGATLTTDRFGNQNGAYDFDGVNDYVDLGDMSAYIDNLGQFTLSYWVNSELLFYGYQGNLSGGVFAHWVNHSAGVHPIGIQSGISPQGKIEISVIGGQGTSSSFQLNPNQTYNVIVTFNGSLPLNERFKLYINGNFQEFLNLSPSTGNFGNIANQTAIGGYVGPSPNGVYSRFNGKLDDIGIWNRALTPQEITNLYNSQLPTQTSLCLPTITTSSPSSVGVDTVVIGGDISNDGGSSIVLRGICYSTSPNPNMGDQRTEDGSGTGSFNTVLRGLASSTTYYARSYAKNSNGVVVYGNEVSFTTSASLPGVRCPGTPTVTDIDGNIYNTVHIGTQCWTQSNLKVSKYMNGDNIPMGLSNSAWENTTSGAYAIYNNDPMNDGLFGKLYNNYAVTDSRGLCPTGWHVPTDGEWTILENYLGGSSVAGGALKSTATQPTPGGWASPNSGATNSSGFTALPGGLRDESGDFNGVSNGYWWSSTVSSGSRALYRDLSYTYNYFGRVDYYRSRGFSVRCLKNTLPQVNTTSVTNVTPSTALATGEVISDGGDQNTSRGFCYSITSNPTISNDTTLNGTGLGAYLGILTNLTPSSTYYVRAYSTNRVGTSYGNELSFLASLPPSPQSCPGTPTVTDIDGNVYNAVQIGTQCWTQSNLKVSKYRNGDNIPTGLNNSDWQSTTSGAYAIYNNDSVNDGLFGKLYNHYAVTDSRGLCPTGWHVPTDAEWTTLENHLGGSGVAGGALKSTAMRPIPGGWNPPNTGATNSSGFTGLPGGMRNNGGDLGYMAEAGFWWSSSLWHGVAPLYRALDLSSSTIIGSTFFFVAGFSVRCLKNTLPQVNTTSVTNVTSSTALVTGEVISEGGLNTTRGFCYSTTFSPTISNDTTMNGNGIGIYGITLHNLNPSTTYFVRAYATNGVGTSYGIELIFTTDSLPGVRCPGIPAVTDIDGNVYNTVQIGNQCWTQNNLKVSKYRNGDNIPTGLNNSQWSATTSGAYAILDNHPENDSWYGKLYNHYAVTDSRYVCPSGWHVPSDAEWTTLENHLGGSSVAGGALKCTPTYSGWVPWDTGATNLSGFTALPGDHRSPNGYAAIYHRRAYFWSSTVSSMANAYGRTLFEQNINISRSAEERTNGYSVRCLKNTLPQVNTTSVTNVTPSTELVTGEVISEGDQNTTRGFCYSTTSNPTISNDTTMNGTGLGVYSDTLRNLTPSTTYYVRAYATNSVGTSYGTELSFTTQLPAPQPCPGIPTVTDIDGNIYNTVQIGNQCWTQSNLKVSKYRNGDSITTGLNNSAWQNTTSGAYAIYDNNPVNDGLYGKLYNHHAVTDSRGLCPTGWHVPSDGEWNFLVKYLDPNADTVCGVCWQSSIAGDALKSTALQPTPGGWPSFTGATNSSGFTALPGGVLVSSGIFTDMPYFGNWWSSSVSSGSSAWYRGLGTNTSGFYRYFNGIWSSGFSVRCLKD